MYGVILANVHFHIYCIMTVMSLPSNSVVFSGQQWLSVTDRYMDSELFFPYLVECI